VFEDLELEEWNGVVLSKTQDGVLETLRKVRERDGYLVIWGYQKFRHHYHPTPDYMWKDGIPESDEKSAIDEQANARSHLGQLLARSFPTLSFVVETDWLSTSTWYQPFEDAPLDDGDFKPMIPSWGATTEGLDQFPEEQRRAELKRRSAESKARAGGPGSGRNCTNCGKCDWSEPFELDEIRGVRWMTCNGCGHRAVEGTRIIRDHIGDIRSMPQPEVP
jgi:hypothetical protein